MNKNEKCIMILGIFAIFVFMLVAGYCEVYIIETRKEDDRRAAREASWSQYVQTIVEQEHIVVSDEKPQIIIANYNP